MHGWPIIWDEPITWRPSIRPPLTHCASHLSPVLLCIFNRSISESDVPPCYKASTIVAVPKNGIAGLFPWHHSNEGLLKKNHPVLPQTNHRRLPFGPSTVHLQSQSLRGQHCSSTLTCPMSGLDKFAHFPPHCPHASSVMPQLHHCDGHKSF